MSAVRTAIVALLLALGVPALLAAAGPEGRGTDEDVVVLVHGLGRTPLSMLPLAWALEREGYRVVNWGYPSVGLTVPELGERLARELDEVERDHTPARVHLVGHSLGNIIIRWVLAHQPPAHAGHVVMLAPPNRGSASADRYAPWLGWLLTPLPELTTGEGSTARSLATPAGVEIGVIAGERDGKVRVEETHVEGETAHRVVSSHHTFIMALPAVHALVIRFLRTGSFDVDEDGADTASSGSACLSRGCALAERESRGSAISRPWIPIGPSSRRAGRGWESARRRSLPAGRSLPPSRPAARSAAPASRA